ncbi:MAG: C40 family peptidase [Pyrinomonadaceae bacterium]
MTVTKLPVRAILLATVCCLLTGGVLANTHDSRLQSLIDNKLNPVQTFFSPALPVNLINASSSESLNPIAFTNLRKELLFAPDNFAQALYSAINSRLGTRYRYGAEGGHGFDCSGFVWNVFQSVGITFDRASARSMWATFPHVNETDKTRFGTLVFFNRLGHIGIVVDDHGFYHASRSHGVEYAPFNDYWKKRIVGFRRIPLPADSNPGYYDRIPGDTASLGNSAASIH